MRRTHPIADRVGEPIAIAPADPILAVHGVSKSFPLAATAWRSALRETLLPLRARPRTTALHPLDLEIVRGSTVALVGENGAGKTTFLRILAGLLIPERGEVHLDGRSVSDPRTLRRNVAWVPCDDRSFVARLSARENLRYFADLVPGPRIAGTRLDDVLAELDLADHADRPYRTLSSGQRQRLAIARGWLRSPRVLILDEPTRSLDPDGSAQLFAWLASQRAEDPARTVLLSTHRLEEAERHADRIITIDDGRVVDDRTLSDARRVPANAGGPEEGVRYALRTEPVLSPETWGSLPGVTECRATFDALHVTLAVTRSGAPAVDALVDHLRSRRVSITSLAPIEPDRSRAVPSREERP